MSRRRSAEIAQMPAEKDLAHTDVRSMLPKSMLTLAIEMSSGTGSVALLRDNELLSEESWRGATRSHQELLSRMPGLLAGANTGIANLDKIAVGLGPGSFTGLRVAMSVAQAIALPDGKPVVGVSSGAALARETATDGNNTSVVTIGDARRQRLWCARFTSADDIVMDKIDYSLIELEELPQIVESGDIIATPDWNRLADKLNEIELPAKTVIREERVPHARSVGAIAAGNGATRNLTPIYLHPPVR